MSRDTNERGAPEGTPPLWLALPFARGRRRSRFETRMGPVAYILDPVPSKRKAPFGGFRAVPLVEEFRIRRRADGKPEETLLLDLKRLHKGWGYSECQMWRMAEKGLPFLMFDGKMWFLPEELDRWMVEAKAKGLIRGPQRGRKKVRSDVHERTRERLGGLRKVKARRKT